MGCDDLHKKRKKRQQAQQAQHAKKLRQQNIRILILTEGSSEDIYFTKILSILKHKAVEIFKHKAVEIKKSDYTDSNSIVKEAITLAKKALKEGSEYNYIFCVFDLDTVRNKEYIDTINKYKSKLTKIFPIYSYPCIEMWFILHFEYRDIPFSRQFNHSIGQSVEKYLLDNYLTNYSKTGEDCILSIAKKYKTAIENAKNLANKQQQCASINPITTVHKLLIFLESLFVPSTNCQFIRDIEVFIESQLPY